MAAANDIVPYVSTAATSFAAGVVESARNRLADSVVERGRALLDRLLHPRPEDPPQGPRAHVAVTAVENLSTDDRLVLEAAVGEWMSAREDLSADTLRHRIRVAHDAYSSSDTYNVSSHGANSPAIGRISQATMTFGRAERSDG